MRVDTILLVIVLMTKALANGQENVENEDYTFTCIEHTDNLCTNFSSTPGLPSPEVILNSRFGFNPATETYFYLFTKKNPVDPVKLELEDFDTVLKSNFDADKPTKVIIHGYFNNRFSPVNTEITAAYLANYDVNVIVVDWSAGANNLFYNIAAGRTKGVAVTVAQFLDQLLDADPKMWEQLTVVGHSLGAHTAGLVGKYVTSGKIGKIVGLDPAGPLFRTVGFTSRLHRTDATFVEVVHTNWRLLGILQALGTVDYYPK